MEREIRTEIIKAKQINKRKLVIAVWISHYNLVSSLTCYTWEEEKRRRRGKETNQQKWSQGNNKSKKRRRENRPRKQVNRKYEIGQDEKEVDKEKITMQ